MKISLGFQSLPPDSAAAARACLVINLLFLPGFGSWIAGRKVGAGQITLALIGFAMSTIWMVSFVGVWITRGEYPWTGGPHLRLGLVGMAAFALAWLWALGTSLSIVRQSRRD